MKILIVVAALALACPVFAEVVKVDDTTVRYTEEVENQTDYTLKELDHEIEGCVRDLEVIDGRVDTQRQAIADRKASLEAIKAEALALGVKEEKEMTP